MLGTDKMEYEMGSVKMYFAGEGAAEVGEVDTRTLGGSWLSSGPPARGQGEAAVGAEHIDRRPLQAYCTAHSSQRPRDKRGHFVAAEGGVHMDHKQSRHSEAVDTECNVVGRGHIGAEVGGVGDAVEARRRNKAYDMVVGGADA